MRRYVLTRAGVRIGASYVPAAPQVNEDARKVQRALLDPRTAPPPSRIARVLAFFWRWC